MRIKTAIYTGHPRYGFHGNEPAEVLGVRFVRLESKEWRACLLIRFGNGDEDYVPLEEAMKAGYLKPKPGEFGEHRET